MAHPVDRPEALSDAVSAVPLGEPGDATADELRQQDDIRLEADALEKFTAAVCRAVGTPEDIAADVATVLVAADRRGIAPYRHLIIAAAPAQAFPVNGEVRHVPEHQAEEARNQVEGG